ncbi:MAG: ABC transporter ATP-binding protein, partial [Erysipelotrichaceae bacterium]|nr:ABC transporter ATP-binding protein [Erysipelotrichaceae bacterium]
MIEIRNLTFAYEKDNPVLKDISFTAEDGECIGLIG